MSLQPLNKKKKTPQVAKIMETTAWFQSGVEISETIFYKSIQLLAYENDKRFLLSRKNMPKLMVNQERSKSKHFTSWTTLEVVKVPVYLGTMVTQDNNISLEISWRIELASSIYFELSNQMRSKALSWKTKILLYKTLILSVLLNGS